MLLTEPLTIPSSSPPHKRTEDKSMKPIRRSQHETTPNQ
jgi:hypothetical protein